MPTEPDEPAPGEARQRFWRWFKWVVLAIIVGALTVQGYIIWPLLGEAWDNIGRINLWWVAASALIALASMEGFAHVQRSLLRSAGVTVRNWESLAVVLSANSLSQTMPAGQVLAPAFTYRETRKWGASPVVASWQVVMSGLLAGVSLAAIAFMGTMLGAAQVSPFSLIFAVASLAIFVTVIQYLAGHPEILQSAGERVLTRINTWRDKPLDHGVGRLTSTLEQLRAVKLHPLDALRSFLWSVFNRGTDFACLLFACWAVGAEPSIVGVMVAYAAGRAAGTAIPLLPGGLGVVDMLLLPMLVSAGMPTSMALTTILVYRLVSYVFISALGWVVIAFKYRTTFRTAPPPDQWDAQQASGSGGSTEPPIDPDTDTERPTRDTP